MKMDLFYKILRYIFIFIFLSITQIGFASEKYKKQLAACLFFQNEAPYLKEWIEYHHLIGFEYFYLYNNESTDNYFEVLFPYMIKGIVKLKNVPGISQNQQEHASKQYAAYREALVMAKGQVKWLALIDADEFIVPIQKSRLIDVLNDYDEFGGVYMNWQMLGTSGYKKIPKDKLMIEALTFGKLELETLGKSIVRPERVSMCCDAHRHFYIDPYVHVNTNFETFDWFCPKASDKLIIYHYYTRDQDHLIHVKYPRRIKWSNLDLNDYIQMGEEINQVEHQFIQKFVPKLRKRMHLR